MQITVTGLGDISRRLKALPGNVQRVALIKGVRAAAVPILATAKALVPRDTGTLAKSLEVRFTRRGVNRVGAAIGVFSLKTKARVRRVIRKAGGAGNFTAKQLGDTFYARMVEFGHRTAVGGRLRRRDEEITAKGRKRRTKLRESGGLQTGTVAGWVAPRPFLRPAFDGARAGSVAAIAQAINEEINRVGSS